MAAAGREVGIGIQGDRPLADYGPLGHAVEEFGFDSVAVFGDPWYVPPIVPLAAIAAATDRIRLGPSCLNPFSLAPSEIAGQTAALDALSGGRAFLGIARGAWLDSVGVTQQDALSAVRDAIGITRAMLAADASGYAGRAWTIPPGQRFHYPVVRPSVPVMVGTWSPRMSALAGEIGDEVKVGASANPEMARQVRAWIEPGARRAGRDPDEVGVVLGAVTIVDRDGETALRRARTVIAGYLDVVGQLDPTATIDPDLLARIAGLTRAGRRDEAGALIPADLVRCFAFAGTPTDIIEHVEAAYAAGATRVEFNAPYGLDGSPELLARAVLPAVRRGG